jgi:hypothetical protein
VLSAAACRVTLPPAAAPEAIVPQVDVKAPLAQGQGRLVVDVADGPSSVQQVHMRAQEVDDGQGGVRFQFLEAPELLCAASPCVTDLPTGNLLLGFPVVGDPGAMEVELVHVGAETSVYSRTLSQYNGRTGKTRVLGIIGTALGGTAATAGVALLPVGLAKDIDGLTIAGGVSLVAGSALLALGIWAIRSDSPTYRPGSSIHFPLP